jgi:arylsulfatase A
MAVMRPIVLLLLAFLAALHPNVEAAPPNVVLIFVDDMGYGDIGPFGNTKVRTPNLDQFAREGMKFTSFYATPVCSMSRACLMTGCYNARVSIPGVLFPGSQIGINSEETTVAEVLKSRGYSTICIGKWHLGHREPFLPTRHGFDSYFGIPYSNDMTLDTQHAKFAKDCVFRDGFTEEKARAEAIKHSVPLMRGDEVVEYPADQDTLTKRYTEEAVKFIRERSAGPFFVYLPHTMVHVPLAASADFRGKSGAGLLGDAIEELDWSVGQIMRTLKDQRLDENTLVIFTSDNGAASGSAGPWRGKKGSNYEGGVREPCIMRWPGMIPAGTTCNHIAGNIDLLPTLAKIAGAELPDRTLDGRDISPLLFDPQAASGRDVHLYFLANEKLQGIRMGDWKLLLTPPNPGNKKAQAKQAKTDAKPAGPELYNLADDPAETKNLADEHPDLVVKLRREAEQCEAEIVQNNRPPGRVSRQ